MFTHQVGWWQKIRLLELALLIIFTYKRHTHTQNNFGGSTADWSYWKGHKRKWKDKSETMSISDAL